MVSVMRLAAIGAITLARMLYLMPSLARVSVKPTWASFAAANCQLVKFFRGQPAVLHSVKTYQNSWSGRSYQINQQPTQC